MEIFRPVTTSTWYISFLFLWARDLWREKYRINCPISDYFDRADRLNVLTLSCFGLGVFFFGDVVIILLDVIVVFYEVVFFFFQK